MGSKLGWGSRLARSLPLGVVAWLCAHAATGCYFGRDTCWNLQAAERLAIELVEPYTPDSSYTYRRLQRTPWDPPDYIDGYPSCGSSFDFVAGETLHTVVTEVESDEQSDTGCRMSKIRIDSPLRLEAKGEPLVSSWGDPVLWGGDEITVDGCRRRRELSVLSTRADGGRIDAPLVVGEEPPLVLVRAVYLPPRPADGSCDLPTTLTKPERYCVDQFVVRIERE